MTPLQVALSYISLLLLAVAFAGVLVRRRFRSAPVFTVYLGVIWLADFLMVSWPSRFHTKDIWLFREVLTAALRFGVAAELAYWTFRGFPTAALTLKRTLLLALTATYVGVVSIGSENTSYPALVAEVLPRIANGTVWVLTAISLLVLWYRLPLRPFQKAILIGFAPYLLVFTVARGVLSWSEWKLLREVGYVDTAAYLLLEAYWCYAAWRSVEEPISPPRRRSLPVGLQTSAGHP